MSPKHQDGEEMKLGQLLAEIEQHLTELQHLAGQNALTQLEIETANYLATAHRALQRWVYTEPRDDDDPQIIIFI